MINTETKYLGVTLKNPIIVGSSDLTGSLDSLRQLEQAGAGAVILKPIFEEEFIYDIKRNTHVVAHTNNYGENYEYVAQRGEDQAVAAYLDLIVQAKLALSIPVIACIDCFSYENWITYAKQLEEAGCDAIQLNVSILPFDTSLSADDVERSFNDIVRTMNRITSLPIDMKVSPYFTDLSKFLQQLSWMGVQGISIFNRPLTFDVDVDNLNIVKPEKTLVGNDRNDTLLWLSILQGKLKCELSAATADTSDDVVLKMLLMGAGSVQLTASSSDLSPERVSLMVDSLHRWMEKHDYASIADFKGMISLPNVDSTYAVMRTMMMKKFF